MEQFNPGDKVCWVSRDLEGKVTIIVDQNTVMVELHNGLEIEADTTDITRRASAAVYEKGKISREDDRKFGEKKLGKTFSELVAGLYLFKSYRGGDLYFINNTSHQVYWAIAKVWGGQMQTLSHKMTEKESYERINAVEVPKITKDISLFVQGIFLAPRPGPFTAPFSFHLTLKTKGEKWVNKSPLPSMSEKGNLYRLDSPQDEGLQDISIPKLEKEEVGQSPAPPYEVDLHIEKLTRHYSKMENDEVLRYQLGAFEQNLEKAISAQCRSITFIHGVGEGVLKTAIIDKLRKHPHVKDWEDAPEQRYGKGATVVWLKQHLKE